MTPPRLGTIANPALAHQIVISVHGMDIAVSCNCLATGRRGAGQAQCTPLEVRSLWQPGEAYERWRQHMADIGIVIAQKVCPDDAATV